MIGCVGGDVLVLFEFVVFVVVVVWWWWCCCSSAGSDGCCKGGTADCSRSAILKCILAEGGCVACGSG